MSEEICPKCEGSGFINDKKCKCVLKDELTNFLGKYSRYKYNKKYTTASRLYDDMFFNGLSMETFGSVVKSFLSYNYLTERNLRYADISGQDMVTIHFGADEMFEVGDLKDVDILILRLGRDSYNKSLGLWLLNLITTRKENNKLTWVYVYPNITATKLKEFYGDELVSFLQNKENFKTTNG